MQGPVPVIFNDALRDWTSRKGFVLVVIAATLPLILTGAWAITHEGDLEATELDAPDNATEGAPVTITGTVTNNGQSTVGEFNTTVAAGRAVQGQDGAARLQPVAQNVTTSPGLDAGESLGASLDWTPNRAGVFWVVLQADSNDTVPESEEFNNQKVEPIVVRVAEPDPDEGPQEPGGLEGDEDANRTVDLAVASIEFDPGNPAPGNRTTVTATIANVGNATAKAANASLRFGAMQANQLRATASDTANVTLEPGETTTIELTTAPRQGVMWAQASVTPPNGTREAHATDNVRNEPLAVNPQLGPGATPPDPPDRLTLIDFFRNTLTQLHLKLVVPLIALFYMGGVVTEDRRKGALDYLLARPVPRWAIPTARFAAGLVVGGLAIAAGVLATYPVLFTAGEDALSLVGAPLVLSLLALFVYGAFFTLLGVLVDRPYLWGVGFVVGWETLAGFFLPWVNNLTIGHHIGNLMDAWWPFGPGEPLAPTLSFSEPTLGWLVVAGLVMLGLAGTAMRRREFRV
jgi:hypothetical protein